MSNFNAEEKKISKTKGSPKKKQSKRIDLQFKMDEFQANKSGISPSNSKRNMVYSNFNNYLEKEIAYNVFVNFSTSLEWK